MCILKYVYIYTQCGFVQSEWFVTVVGLSTGSVDTSPCLCIHTQAMCHVLQRSELSEEQPSTGKKAAIVSESRN